jgi:UDP-N-acetylmuramyl pentapeptide phosphotransferase/UDP-N-acetylglucosamine-1-phosphate transferase
MKEIIDNLFDKYPWIVFFIGFLILIGDKLLGYRVHKNKGVAAGGLFFLMCFLAYAVSTMDAIGNAKWVLVLCVLGFGWWAIKRFVK